MSSFCKCKLLVLRRPSSSAVFWCLSISSCLNTMWHLRGPDLALPGSVWVAHEVNTPQLAVQILNLHGIQTDWTPHAFTSWKRGGCCCCGFKTITKYWSSQRHLLCNWSVKCCQGVLASFEDKEGAVFMLWYYRDLVFWKRQRYPENMERNMLWQLLTFSNYPEINGLHFGWEEWMLPELKLTALLNATLRHGQSLHRLTVAYFFPYMNFLEMKLVLKAC